MQRRLRILLEFVALASFIILVWVAAWYIYLNAPDMIDVNGQPLKLADRATILFGAASTALFVLSIVAGAVGLSGWISLKRSIQKSLGDELSRKNQALESDLRKKLENLGKEMHGRIYSGLGFMIGEMSHEPGTFEVKDADRLRHSVKLCEQGYKLLREIGGPAEYMALNNLVHYSSMDRDELKRDLNIKRARELREAGQKHDAIELILTYCGAIVQYDGDFPEDLESARLLVSGILKREVVSEGQRREARYYLASLNQKLGARQPNG
jgi:hypothetical protein